MANKKVSQLVSKPSVLVTDLFPIADPTTGQLFKTTISDLGTAIGSGVSSVNTLVGAVVLDTDDIQELASPTNRWFTDTRARAAISGGTGISYNSGTGVITNAVTSGQIATALGYTPADDALVVKLAGSQTITGTKTFQQAPLMDIGVGFKNGSGVYNYLKSINTGWEMPVNGQNHNLIFNTGTNYTYTFPNASGTIALTSDLSAYVPYTGATANLNLGLRDLIVSSITVTGLSNNSGAGVLNLSKAPTRTVAGVGYLSLFAADSVFGFVDFQTANTRTALFSVASISSNTTRTYTLPNSNGTLALTSDLSAYLPLAGGTMTGVLFGASASFSGFVGFGGNTSPLAAVDVTGAGIFSSSVRSSGYYLTGMTAGSGALYYNAGANRVTVANYNASGIVTFEVNGGSTALTLNSNLSSTFAGAISGTSATFSTDLTLTNSSFTLLKFVNTTASNTWNMYAYSDGSFNLGVSGVGNFLGIASTGAATFSSSVTATSMSIINSNPALSVTDNTNTSFFATASSGGAYGNGTTAGDAVVRGSGGISLVPAAGAFTALKILSNGNVGIGTTAPGAALDVVSAIRATNSATSGFASSQLQLFAHNGSSVVYGGGIFHTSSTFAYQQIAANQTNIYGVGANGIRIATANAPIIFNTGNSDTDFSTERMRITAGGDVCIASTAPVSTRRELRIGGNAGGSRISMGLNGTNYSALVTDSGGNVYLANEFNDSAIRLLMINFNNGVYLSQSATSWTSNSDERMKTDLVAIENATEKVASLRSVIGRYKTDDESKRRPFLIAQDVHSVLPEAVDIDQKTGMMGIQYTEVIPLLVASIKELKSKIETLENK